jgi:hypothetical protein
VLTSIQLNHQLRFMAAKVSDEITNRKLAPEMEAVQPAGADSVPEFGFRVSLLTTQSAGALVHEWYCSFVLAS